MQFLYLQRLWGFEPGVNSGETAWYPSLVQQGKKSDSSPSLVLCSTGCQPVPAQRHMSVNWSQLILVTSLQSSDHTHISLIRKPKLRKSENLPKDDGAAMLSVPSARLVFRWKLSKYTQWTSSTCTVSFDYSSLKPWETRQEVSTFQEKNLRFRVDFSQLYWLASVKAAQIPGVVFILFCFYWGRFDLQYCIRFRYTVKWLSYICVYIHICVYIYVCTYISYIYV